MAGVEAEQFAARDGVAEVEFVRADGATLRADAKEFSFNGVEVVFCRERLLENFVERGGETFARSAPVGGRVLESVGNPDVGDAGRPESFAHRGADFARAAAVFNPELANAFVAMREGEAVSRFWMCEARRVEVEAEPVGFGPGNPVLKVRDFDFVAVHLLAAKFAIHRVEIDAMLAGNQRQRLLQIHSKLVGSTRLAGVFAGDGQPAAGIGPCQTLSRTRQSFVGMFFEAADVITLPAVDRDGNLRERFERAGHGHAEGGVTFGGQAEGFVNRLVRHDDSRSAACPQIPKSYLSMFSFVNRIGSAMMTVFGSCLLNTSLP